MDTAKQTSDFVYMYAMSASEYYNDKVVVDWSTDESSLGIMDQLYTARGS